MNKKIIASLSAFVLSTSFVTVSAATTTTAKKPTISAAMQALQDQVKANKKAENDIVNQAKQTDAYKQLQAKAIELQKSVIDQEVTDGKITADQATKLKNQIDVQVKLKADTTLQNLEKNIATYVTTLQTLKTKYTDNATLIASQEFKDLKTQVVTNSKAIVDQYAADGAITADQATKQKANIDTISANIDAGKANLNQLFSNGHDKDVKFKKTSMKKFNGKAFGKGFGKGFNMKKGGNKNQKSKPTVPSTTTPSTATTPSTTTTTTGNSL